MNKKGIDLLLDIAQHDDRALELLRMAALGDGLAAVLDRASCTKARNAELIQAANILGADGCGPWPTAVRLAGYVKRFRASVLPRLRPGSLIQLSPVEACLYRAFLTGERMPSSARYLHELLK